MIFLKHKKPPKISPCTASKTVPLIFRIIYRKLLNTISFESQYSRMPGNFQRCVLFAICCSQIPLPVLSRGPEKPAQENPSHKGRDSQAWGGSRTPGRYGAAARKPRVALLDSSHPQLRLSKMEASALSTLDSCCPDRDDRVWRISYETLAPI